MRADEVWNKDIFPQNSCLLVDLVCITSWTRLWVPALHFDWSVDHRGYDLCSVETMSLWTGHVMSLGRGVAHPDWYFAEKKKKKKKQMHPLPG